jgi:hypothetical protein
MSSSDAQRSPVHSTTDDSTAEPSGPAPSSRQPPQPPQPPPPRHPGAGADTGDLARQAADLKNRPDTAEGIPSNFETGAALAGVVPDTDDDANPPSSVDASAGGGAGAGIPGGGTDLRTGGAFNAGNPDEDRQRLFPDAPDAAKPGQPKAAFNDETKIGADPDESTYGGPLNLDDPNAV